jgi:hypothetical protein
MCIWVFELPSESCTKTICDHLNLVLVQISDAVYLLREPSEGKPEIEIVFIHGLQLSAYNDAYWETWTTVDEKGEKICWPMTWLAEEIPQARILALSYDSSALRTRTQGRTDSYLVGESLLAEMVDFGDIGQSGCPLLFVCHSLGGIVIKEIVKMAAFQRRDNEKIQKFLKSIIGFHFYATYVPLLKQGPFVKTLEVINDDLGRLNKDFKSIAKKDFGDKWKYSVVAEKWATTCVSIHSQCAAIYIMLSYDINCLCNHAYHTLSLHIECPWSRN